MIKTLVDSAIQNFSLTDLLVFSTFFVFVYNTYRLKKEVNNQKEEINKYEITQEELNQKAYPKITDGTAVNIITVTQSFSKYGLISLGKNSKITSELKAGNKIVVKYNDKQYIGKVHKSVLGRIDGLTAMYRDNIELIEKSTMEVTYDMNTKEITIK